MSINVEWQDERGNRLAWYDGPPIDTRIIQRASSTSACLRFIDPYGDTTFNDAQVTVLEQELLSLLIDQALAVQAKSLLNFIRQMNDRTHHYLKFIGD